MKLRVTIIVFMVLFFGNASKSQTQIKRFTPDSIKFFEEISKFLIDERKKEGKKFIEEFELIWYGGVLSKQKRRGVYRTCNFMLGKKMQPFPEFRNYLFSFLSFVKNEKSDDSFDAWQQTLERIVETKNAKRKLGEYLKFSNHLFEENAMYKSSTTKWISRSTDYQFEFGNEPFIVYPSLDLVCYSKGDSTVIYNTQGIYYPLKKKWIGNGGKVDWQRAGFSPNRVYATINNYEIKMKGSSFKADSVTFNNSFYFDKPLKGRLHEKVTANVTPEKASYPRFESYDKRLKIQNIMDKVDYDGGFSQHGAKFIGSGSEEEDALLIFNRNDTAFLIASSKSFIIRTNKITSQSAGIVMYLDEDSVTHPGLKLNFLSESRKLSLVRTDEGVSRSPFFNTYHKIDMRFEELRWNIDEPTIFLGTFVGTTDKSASFESDDYYKEARFDRLQGIENRHPLYRIAKCARDIGSQELYAEDISQCFRIAISQIRLLLMALSQQGFLHYDYDDDHIHIKRRLYHYLNSKSGKDDYDVIQFNSYVGDETNAQINLLNNDMRVMGVRQIFLSDSHQVYLYPIGREILLKKNRDFDFSGIVNAGKFEYFGKEFEFLYDDFKIDMPNVDSLRIYVTTGERDDKGRLKEQRVKSVIENIRGELLIDYRKNKSGLKDSARYPIFNSLKESYVYYQKQTIQKGVYARDSFYFQLTPFSFDSIDNFRNEALGFDGSFTSGGIFPTFDEKLTLQEDLSLGFLRSTPPEGFPIYGGKGTYTNLINLSHGGLRGDGTLNYLTSTTESNEFIFFPDSMNALAQNFLIEEKMQGVEYPPTFGQNVKIHWEPYKDFLTAKNTNKPFAMYDGSKMNGLLTLSPKELTGNGTIRFKGAEMKSNLMVFKFMDFSADTAEFKLKSRMESGVAEEVLSFATDNVKAHIDFRKRKGDFLSNGGGSFIKFPQNQYIAFMDKFTWFMESDDIELSATTKVQSEVAQDVQLEGSKFISVHEKQDSLSFYSPAARYDVKRHIIYAKKVIFIPVADALIYPDSGNVVVEKKAKIRTLENSRIVANKITKYHEIYNAATNVFGRQNYTSSGYYDYLDENKKIQQIKFDVVSVDSTAQTYALGEISEEKNFTLSPVYEYKGNVRLTASKEFLKFTGTSRIQHNCETLPRTWFSFSGEIEPDEIYIPIDSTIKDDQKNILGTSIMLHVDSAHVYSSFVSPKVNRRDREVLPSFGFMRYDKKKSEYQISNLAKLNEISLPGNYLSLNTKNCKIYGEGKIDFGTKFGQLKIKTAGNAQHYLKSDSIIFDVMLLMDFFFVNNALENMAKKINAYQGLDGVDFDRPVYEKGLHELLGKEQAGKSISDLNLYGQFRRFPADLNKPLFISELKMHWNKKTSTYQSTSRIGLGNVYKKQINKYVDGYVEIEHKRSGDIINIYLELDKKNWYFFNYQRGIMQALSSDADFNDIIKEVKTDKRKLKVEKGQPTYMFILSTFRKRNEFLKRFEEE